MYDLHKKNVIYGDCLVQLILCIINVTYAIIVVKKIKNN